jgi:hypothetical protein
MNHSTRVMRRCMQGSGFPDFPGPQRVDGGTGFPGPSELGIDPHSPQFRSADHLCQSRALRKVWATSRCRGAGRERG